MIIKYLVLNWLFIVYCERSCFGRFLMAVSISALEDFFKFSRSALADVFIDSTSFLDVVMNDSNLSSMCLWFFFNWLTSSLTKDKIFLSEVQFPITSNDQYQARIHFTIVQLKCILAYHWSFVFYDVIFYRHYKQLYFYTF